MKRNTQRTFCLEFSWLCNIASWLGNIASLLRVSGKYNKQVSDLACCDYASMKPLPELTTFLFI